VVLGHQDLCTTVGETLRRLDQHDSGVGLVPTAVIFTVVLAAVLGWQLSLNRYVAFVYWLTVVVLSVTGSLYTDILTECSGVPPAVSTRVFRGRFWPWRFRRVVRPRADVVDPQHRHAAEELFVLARSPGDLRPGHGGWRLILELTGWGPGTSVLLPPV